MGLSSQEALKRLLNALSDELAIFKEVNHCTWRQDLWNTLGQNRHLPMSFISLTFLILEFLVLVLSYGLAGSERRYSHSVLEHCWENKSQQIRPVARRIFQPGHFFKRCAAIKFYKLSCRL